MDLGAIWPPGYVPFRLDPVPEPVVGALVPVSTLFASRPLSR